MDRFITHEQFKAAAKLYPDYLTSERWEYYQIAASLCPDGKLLEIGPFRQALTVGQVYLDIKDWSGVRPLILTDLNEPLPLADDMFVGALALQVIEHTHNPAAVIREVMRVARTAVISIPWKWPRGEPGHAGIDEKVLNTWVGGYAITNQSVLGNKPHLRTIFRLERS